MGLLSNRISRESLKPGDHIYSWRAAYIYAHHGIYIGDEKVVHFTGRGQEAGAGTVLDRLLVCSMPTKSYVTCLECTTQGGEHGVVLSCLNCFLAGGGLYRFEYGVNPALFLANVRGGTCTRAAADQNDIVVHRAKCLLEHGFGCYNLFKNNCEDFAIYCKTERLVLDQGIMGQSGQAASIIGVPLGTVISTLLHVVTRNTNVYGMAAAAVRGYCISRYATDVGMKKDVVKFSVESLTRMLASSLQVGEAQEVDGENMVAIASQSTEAPKVDVASSHYSTLFDERLQEELQDIQENLQRKNEELQQKNEEMQKQIEEMKKGEEESLKTEKEMQQKIEQIEQIMRMFTQSSSTSQS